MDTQKTGADTNEDTTLLLNATSDDNEIKHDLEYEEFCNVPSLKFEDTPDNIQTGIRQGSLLEDQNMKCHGATLKEEQVYQTYKKIKNTLEFFLTMAEHDQNKSDVELLESLKASHESRSDNIYSDDQNSEGPVIESCNLKPSVIKQFSEMELALEHIGQCNLNLQAKPMILDSLSSLKYPSTSYSPESINVETRGQNAEMSQNFQTKIKQTEYLESKFQNKICQIKSSAVEEK